MAIAIDLPPQSSWADITEGLDGSSPPLTLAKPEGVGALQFSGASYRAGPVPHATAEVLREMLVEFGQAHQLGEPTAMVVEQSPLKLAAASFHADAFFRVWYLSDGENFGLATYTCALENEHEGEVVECEQIVRSARFT